MSILLEYPGKMWYIDDSVWASLWCKAHSIRKTILLLCKVLLQKIIFLCSTSSEEGNVDHCYHHCHHYYHMYINSFISQLLHVPPSNRTPSSSASRSSCNLPSNFVIDTSVHWLPIHQRIQYKLCILQYKLCILCMVLLTGIHQTTSLIWLHWHQLRRAGHIFALPTASPSTSLGGGRGWVIVHSRSLVRAWNALPADIRCALSLDTFKKHLKSHLFSAAYDL